MRSAWCMVLMCRSSPRLLRRLVLVTRSCWCGGARPGSVAVCACWVWLTHRHEARLPGQGGCGGFVQSSRGCVNPCVRARCHAQRCRSMPTMPVYCQPWRMAAVATEPCWEKVGPVHRLCTHEQLCCCECIQAPAWVSLLLLHCYLFVPVGWVSCIDHPCQAECQRCPGVGLVSAHSLCIRLQPCMLWQRGREPVTPWPCLHPGAAICLHA